MLSVLMVLVAVVMVLMLVGGDQRDHHQAVGVSAGGAGVVSGDDGGVGADGVGEYVC